MGAFGSGVQGDFLGSVPVLQREVAFQVYELASSGCAHLGKDGGARRAASRRSSAVCRPKAFGLRSSHMNAATSALNSQC